MRGRLVERMNPIELIKKLKRIEIFTRKCVSEQMAGQYHSAFKGRGMDFSQVRPYEDGDDVRYIDWNVSARQNALYVKDFVEEKQLSVYIVMDLSRSMDFSSIAATKREMSAEVMALLASSAIQNNDRVGLFLCHHRGMRFIPQKKGRNHLLRLIRESLSYQGIGEAVSLKDCLSSVTKIIKRSSLIFVISDFLQNDFEIPLRILSHRHDVVPIIIRDPLEDSLADLGFASLYDSCARAQHSIDTQDSSLLKTYSSLTQEFRSSLRRGFARSKLEAITVYTHKSSALPLIQYFKRRG